MIKIILFMSLISLSSCAIFGKKKTNYDVPPPPFYVKEMAAAKMKNAIDISKAINSQSKVPTILTMDPILPPTSSGAIVLGPIGLSSGLNDYRKKKRKVEAKYESKRKALLLELKKLERNKEDARANLLKKTKSDAKKEYEDFIRRLE